MLHLNERLQLHLRPTRPLTKSTQSHGKNHGTHTEENRRTHRKLPKQALYHDFQVKPWRNHSKSTSCTNSQQPETNQVKLQTTTSHLENAGIVMTRSGARGSSLNIGQMAACVGQQSVRGKRILRGYAGRALTTLHTQTILDQEQEASSTTLTKQVLDAIEFFFHAMGGREGLVDTAVRTQQSGYMQRRLINALEHITLRIRQHVRDSAGDIIQFRYGEDGVDPAKSDHGKAVNVIRLIDQVRLGEEKGAEAASADFIKKQLKSVEEPHHTNPTKPT